MDYQCNFDTECASGNTPWHLIEPVKQAPGSPTVGVWSPYAEPALKQRVNPVGTACTVKARKGHPDVSDNDDGYWTIKAFQALPTRYGVRSSPFSLSAECLPLQLGNGKASPALQPASVLPGTSISRGNTARGTSGSSSPEVKSPPSALMPGKETSGAPHTVNILLDDLAWNCLQQGSCGPAKVPKQERTHAGRNSCSNGLLCGPYPVSTAGGHWPDPAVIRTPAGRFYQHEVLSGGVQMSSYQLVHNEMAKGAGGAAAPYAQLKVALPSNIKPLPTAVAVQQNLLPGSIPCRQDKVTRCQYLKFDLELPAGFIDCGEALSISG
jgi:hypothetical protein